MSFVSDGWMKELEEALSEEAVDAESMKKMCQDKVIPRNIRSQLWQKLLGTKESQQTSSSKILLEEFFDLPEQSVIRIDSLHLVQKVDDVDESEKLSLAADVESIMTTLSKKLDVPYAYDNGWMELMKPLLHLRIESKHDIFTLMSQIIYRFVPYKSRSYVQSLHLLRLLILYHDPELCSFLDSKEIYPESYAGLWLRSLLASTISIDVVQSLWDAYFFKRDPFLIFFISLVLLVNSRDQILDMKSAPKEVIINTISSIPSALQGEDISDLLTIIDTHYAPQTPSLDNFRPLIFQTNNLSNPDIADLAHQLCLPIQVKDIIPTTDSPIRYFVIDCRSPEQYNSGHLSTAFHLDCSLMLQDKVAFEITVDALLVVQKQAIDANSVCGGTHLCFVGSGKSDEDSYVYMVVASFLQKNHKFVSLCSGGFRALHDYIRRQRLNHLLSDHDPVKCTVCSPKRRESTISTSSLPSLGGRLFSPSPENQCSLSIFDKLSTAVKTKTSEVKGKIVELVIPSRPSPGSSENLEDRDLKFNVDQWAKEHNAIDTFTCKELKEDHKTYDSFLVLTQSYIFIIRESNQRRGYGRIVAKRPLEMIVQITSKRKIPEIITFKYGETNESSDLGPNIIASDCLVFVKPYDVTRLVKQQVIKVLDGEVPVDAK